MTDEQMRASDADRDIVSDRLREALAEGRLTPEEHAQRIDAVYAAKTMGELTPLTADLPGGRQASDPPRLAESPAAASTTPAERMVAILSGTNRFGRWQVAPSLDILCILGGVDLDFRQAILSARETVINVSCILGGVNIVVPPGVRVINSVSSILGGVDLPLDDDLTPDAPVLRLTGTVLLSGVAVAQRTADDKSPVNPSHDHASLHADRRALQRARRDFRHDLMAERRAIRQARRGRS